MSETSSQDLAANWRAAQRRWSSFLLLGAPECSSERGTVAWMNLGTRRVSLNLELLRAKGLERCLEAVLAHEVGHHVRYPGSLATEARLRLLEKPLLPLPNYSLSNLFSDLLINEYLGGELGEELAAVYRAFRYENDWRKDAAFTFYLAIYEELWGLPPGDLIGPGFSSFEESHPGYRADAQLLVQNLFRLGPNLFTQFLYFVSVMLRYVDVKEEKPPIALDPYQCGCDSPSPDDWADALNPGKREREAIARARREGWISEADEKRLSADIEQRSVGLPGYGTANAEAVPEVMAAWYRQQADRYLVRPPARRMMGEALVPTTLEDWTAGDPVASVDWLATFLARGDALGAALPLRRERIADLEGEDVPLWRPRVEIYLDVSGSMPDPRYHVNAMTLAAQIVAAGAIRAEGHARAALYSGTTVRYWQWCRSERELSKFLMHYIGAGTEFPFPLLGESLSECRNVQPIRLIITDSDFHSNYDEEKSRQRTLREACEVAPVIFLLHGGKSPQSERYERLGAQVVMVPELKDFPGMASRLAASLFRNVRDEVQDAR